MALPLINLLAAASEWAEPDCDARICFTVSGDLFSRTNSDCQVIVDFNDMLGAERVLAADSFALRARGGNERTSLELAQNVKIRYVSGNPILRLQWQGGALKPLAEQIWELYFRAVKPGDPAAWKPIKKTFLPLGPGILFTTSFEEPDPNDPKNPLDFTPVGKDEPGEKSDRTWIDTQAHTGKRSLKTSRMFEGEPPKNNNRTAWRSFAPGGEIQEGVKYKLSAWIKSEKMTSKGAATVFLFFLDEKRQRMSEGTLKLMTGKEPHDWKYLAGTAVAPAGARSAEIQCFLYMEGEAYFDDLMLSLHVVPGSELQKLNVTTGRLEDRSKFAAKADEIKPLKEKVFQCGLAKEPPKLDGILDDACWKEAGQIQDFLPFQTTTRNLKTTVLACADKDALYFGLECEEPQAEQNIIARATGRDGAVWSDSSVEIFLDTRKDGRTYYQIILNPKGILFDQETGDPGLMNEAWNGPIETAAKIEKDRWTAEVRIGLAGLRLADTKGPMWRANFCRTSWHGGASDVFTWSKVKKQFGEPESFGQFVMPFDPSADAVSGLLLTGNDVYCTSRRDKPVDVKVLVLPDKADATPLGEVRVTVPAKGSTLAKIPCAFDKTGEVKLRYEIREEPGNRLLYVSSATKAVPEPIQIAMGTKVSYVSEPVLPGTWALSVPPSALPECKLIFSVNSDDKEIARQVITPQKLDGVFAMPVETLLPGDYELRAEFLMQDKVVKSARLPFARMPGPFIVSER